MLWPDKMRDAISSQEERASHLRNRHYSAASILHSLLSGLKRQRAQEDTMVANLKMAQTNPTVPVTDVRSLGESSCSLDLDKIDIYKGLSERGVFYFYEPMRLA